MYDEFYCIFGNAYDFIRLMGEDLAVFLVLNRVHASHDGTTVLDFLEIAIRFNHRLHQVCIENRSILLC